MPVLRERPSAEKQYREKALEALKNAGTEEVKIMQFPDGSMLIRLTPQSGNKGKSLPEITAEKQRYLLDCISDEQAEEDSEEWIKNIRESRVDTEVIPFAEG